MGDEIIASQETAGDRECTSQEGPPQRDWKGLGRDSLYFVGYQLFAVGVLYVLPEEITSWSDEQKDEYDLDRWTSNVRHPAWDDDVWYVNYVLHPYWGAAYYTRARERGLNIPQSFLYAAFLSATYEFGVEAFFERPSFQDLIVTPLAGSIIGMAFEPAREKIKAKGTDQAWYEKAFLVLTDPLGTANGLLDRLFGINASVSIKREGAKPCAKAGPASRAGNRDNMAGLCSRTYNGIELTFVW